MRLSSYASSFFSTNRHRENSSANIISIVPFNASPLKDSNSIGSSATLTHSNSTAMMKWIILILFVLQDTLLIIALRYDTEYIEFLASLNPSSSAVESDEIEAISSTIVLFTEHTKLVMSVLLFFIFDCKGKFTRLAELLVRGIVSEDSINDILKLCLPAMLYTIQNNLQYVIESAPLFLSFYQLKVVTTAMFYSSLLGRRISNREWFTIIFLAIGVGVAQSSQNDFKAHHASNIIGLLSVIFACLSSGLAGVYFEKIMKASKSSIWVLNIQLSILSSILGTIACLSRDTQTIIEHGWLVGYNSFVIFVIILQAMTGLVIALVVKTSDNIHKGFASALAIILSGFIESYLFPNSFSINLFFMLGSLFVVLSSFMFVVISSNSSIN